MSITIRPCWSSRGCVHVRTNPCASERRPVGVWRAASRMRTDLRSEEHTSELQSRVDLVCRLLLESLGVLRHLHSFPTRRSSDLYERVGSAQDAWFVNRLIRSDVNHDPTLLVFPRVCACPDKSVRIREAARRCLAGRLSDAHGFEIGRAHV